MIASEPTQETNMCRTWVGSRKIAIYQSDSNLWLLFEPLAQLNVIDYMFFGMPYVILTMM